MSKHFNETFFPKVQEKKWFKKLKGSVTFKPDKVPPGGTPMNLKSWFKEYKPSVALWVLVFMLATALATCSELKVTYEYKTPPVVKKLLGNK